MFDSLSNPVARAIATIAPRIASLSADQLARMESAATIGQEEYFTYQSWRSQAHAACLRRPCCRMSEYAALAKRGNVTPIADGFNRGASWN
jgi:hypothetical protein